MKKIIWLFVLLGLVITPVTANAYEENGLKPEVASGPDPDLKNYVEKYSIFQGYTNSKDVTIVGGVLGAVYYFCAKEAEGFCSDMEGIIIVSGADTGKEPEMLQKLDVSLDEKRAVAIKLSEGNKFMGVKKLLDVQLLN